VPEQLLFYAGSNKVHEQIGLAVSGDGRTFERLPEPIVPVDRTVEWRALRTANPAVVRSGGRYEMFFQGIAEGLNHVSIARAVSADGRSWAVDEEPVLPWHALRSHVRGMSPDAARVAVFEPAVLVEDGRYRMWFLYFHPPTHPSNSLFYAESPDGEAWEIDPKPLLSGDDFGFCVLHYPQVVPAEDGYELFFTLGSRRTLVHGIYRARSSDGRSWHGAEPVLRLRHRVVRSRRNAPAKILNRLIRPLLPRHGRNVLGYSHPHVVGDALYLHNDNHGPRGRWYDISRAERRGGSWSRPERVFGPSDDGWDSHFVADPFVIAGT
jgi:hypothetical protein